jgi:hypothetical protein
MSQKMESGDESGDGVRRYGVRRRGQEIRSQEMGQEMGSGDGVGYMKIPPIKKAIAVVKYAIAN